MGGVVEAREQAATVTLELEDIHPHDVAKDRGIASLRLCNVAAYERSSRCSVDPVVAGVVQPSIVLKLVHSYPLH